MICGIYLYVFEMNKTV